MQKSITRKRLGVVTAVVSAVVLLVGVALPARAMTMTFVRHGGVRRQRFRIYRHRDARARH